MIKQIKYTVIGAVYAAEATKIEKAYNLLNGKMEITREMLLNKIESCDPDEKTLNHIFEILTGAEIAPTKVKAKRATDWKQGSEDCIFALWHKHLVNSRVNCVYDAKCNYSVLETALSKCLRKSVVQLSANIDHEAAYTEASWWMQSHPNYKTEVNEWLQKPTERTINGNRETHTQLEWMNIREQARTNFIQKKQAERAAEQAAKQAAVTSDEG